MSRPKRRRAIRADDRPDSRDTALRAELGERLDRLRATIEAKRREGWIMVRSPGPAEGKAWHAER